MFQPVTGDTLDAGNAVDAGKADSEPNLLPLPDGNLPADSRMEPNLLRD